MNERYAFVNEKIVNGISYKAFRNVTDPNDSYVEVEGKQYKCRLKEIWNSTEKLEELWRQ